MGPKSGSGDGSRLVYSLRYVNNENMISHMGTCKGFKAADVANDSQWIQWYPWMRDDEANFSLKTI